MPSHLHKNFVFCFFILVINLRVNSQVTCPSNIDFEQGDFTGWVCKTGSASVSAGQNLINWTATGQVNGRHTMIRSSNTGTDFYGNFPLNCPNGSGFSVLLGNSGTGQQAEGIFYNYTIPSNATNFSLLYQYAVVFQDPANHTPQEQPRFQARMLNLTDNTPIGCVSFDFTADATLPGFQVSPRSTPGNVVLYKAWTPISLDLRGYAGKTIQLEFITSDCTRGGHFGYAYVDVNTSCSGTVVGSTICSGDSTVSLTAPYGFESYQWFSDTTFSQIVGTSQVLTLNPAPVVGTTLPVIVTPYPGFGCVDTVYASITTTPKPVSIAGPDAAACRYQQVSLGTLPNAGYSYLWTPANLISDPVIANPTGFVSTNTPVNFTVKTTDISSGCFSTDSVTIVPKVLDTALRISGATSYCSSQLINTTLQVNTGSTGIQWFNNTTAITGATSATFSPAVSGRYWAQVSQYGCTDSTSTIPFLITPVPRVMYSVTKDSQCVTSNSFAFNNTSTISDNTPISFLWKFNDGSVSQQANPVKHFTTPGIYNIQLVGSSGNSCADSTSGIVFVMPNTFPDFRWDSVCTNRPVSFTNLTNENGSTSVSYLWDFANGSVSTSRDPQPFYYKAGIYDVSLQVTAIGCESDVKIIKHAVNANEAMAGIKYPDKTIPEGYTSLLSARDSKGGFYKWTPGLQLSNTNLRAPVFFGGNDANYTINILDKNACVVIDTMQVFVLKKKGLYLPNAFTPNGDGLNDVVRPYVVGMKSLTKFSVFNRWGNLVFSTTTNGKGWDGTHRGIKLDTGSFVWVLEYVDTDNKTMIKNGSIILIR